MDDLEVASFWRTGAPGTLRPWCRYLIGGTTLATIAVAYLSWHMIWALWGYEWHFYGFWVRNGVWLGFAAASLAILAPPSRVSRFIRLATLMPLVHLAGVVASVVLWLFIEEDARVYEYLGDVMVLPFHPAAGLVIGGVVLAGAAWLICRREWLQTTLVLALSFLFLFGAWLPHSAARWVLGADRELYYTLLSPRAFLETASIPPLIGGLGFTTLVMRRPALARKLRAATVIVVGFLLLLAAMSQRGGAGTLLYLNAAVMVLMALGLAIVVVVGAGIAMWVRARSTRARVESLRGEPAILADADGSREGVVELQIDGWLRAPRIETYPCEIVTSTGDHVAAGGAPVVWSVPPETTRLAIGDRCVVVRRGDAVTMYSRNEGSDGHPFRSTEHVDVRAIATENRSGSFADMTLMLWRPATAYMAIALAVMVPAAIALVAAR